MERVANQDELKGWMDNIVYQNCVRILDTEKKNLVGVSCVSDEVLFSNQCNFNLEKLKESVSRFNQNYLVAKKMEEKYFSPSSSIIDECKEEFEGAKNKLERRLQNE